MSTKRTKIVCTMGPATESDEVLRELIKNGMNVARFNFSHGSHAYHRQNIERVRSISEELGIPVAIMLDTKGPEVRTGLLEGGQKVTVNTGDQIIVTAQPTTEDWHGNAGHISLDYLNLPKEVEKGSIILIDDGLVGLEVDHVEGNDMHCVVTNGGEIGEKKGVNVPNVEIGLPSVTEQDIADIMFGCELGIDAIAASFIRNAQAVDEIRKLCADNGLRNVYIFPKIESALGVKNFDEILAASDGCMVARGDLGVEIPAQEVPHIQKIIIKKCAQSYKPVITATQMLDSMIRNPRPTRAEVNDVANAIYDGTDCVMLSGETAAGKYPVEAVKMMASIWGDREVPPRASRVPRPWRHAQRQLRHRPRSRGGRGPCEREVHHLPDPQWPHFSPDLQLPSPHPHRRDVPVQPRRPQDVLPVGRRRVQDHRAGLSVRDVLQRADRREGERRCRHRRPGCRHRR